MRKKILTLKKLINRKVIIHFRKAMSNLQQSVEAWKIDKTSIDTVKAFALQKCAEYLSGRWSLATVNDIIVKKLS